MKGSKQRSWPARNQPVQKAPSRTRGHPGALLGLRCRPRLETTAGPLTNSGLAPELTPLLTSTLETQNPLIPGETPQQGSAGHSLALAGHVATAWTTPARVRAGAEVEAELLAVRGFTGAAIDVGLALPGRVAGVVADDAVVGEHALLVDGEVIHLVDEVKPRPVALDDRAQDDVGAEELAAVGGRTCASRNRR